ncbi:MAG: damage-control phosphatase [Candidatus Rifleibacteriota bacterium]
MNITIECLPCFVRHTIGVLGEFSEDERLHERVLRKLFKRLAEADYSMSPPELAAEIHVTVRRELACDDPYFKIKKDSNSLAKQIVGNLKAKLTANSNPLYAATMYAIAGNIIDSGVSAVTSIEDIQKSIEMAEKEMPEINDYQQFTDAIERSERILILGDNAGEIFFDKMLIEKMPEGKEIIYAVKSGAILNDATLQDAKEAGIDRLATLIENGTRIPGTPLRKVSPEFKRFYDSADMIISKGQANFETLSEESDERVFFLLRAKCDVIARKLGVGKGSFVIFQSRKKII